ncbi:MAG TPA: response regulator [Opitutaceae bacterium]|nr:response regulator [Opitutaceae bacterium]
MIRVLYAEDDRLTASVVGMHFQHSGAGMSLEIVRSGRECLERMRQGGIDVLLLDLELPDTDGLRVLGELSVRRDSTPVIMVSGRGQTELAVKALRAGAVDCVDKLSPQFLQLASFVQRVHARHTAGAAVLLAPPVEGEKYPVLLVEASHAERTAFTEFFGVHAPQISLLTVATPKEAREILGNGVVPDAAILGSMPDEEEQLACFRGLRSLVPDLPFILVAESSAGESAVAAFKLGAQDYILRKPDYLFEVVFSLGHALRSGSLARRNVQLTRELATLNQSLEGQVAARTAELQALSSRILRIQEDERRAIARELHDQIGQMLTGMRFQLDVAVKQAAGPLAAQLEAVQAILTDLLARTRALTLQFRPRILDDLGLRPALEWHLKLFQAQTGIGVGFECSLPQTRLAGDLETTIFRIVQEALTNVARHSGAQAAELTVVSNDTHVLVEIGDRGKGFDAEQLKTRRDSVGLVSLTERVDLAGGEVEIISSPGKGTRVQASFPLALAEAATP